MTGDERRAAVLGRLQPAPFWDHLGCELVDAGEGTASVRLAPRSEFGRSGGMGDGTLHGGVVSSLIDATASCALITLLTAEEGRTTIDLSVHFLAAAQGTLLATASVRRRGGRTAVIDAEVFSAGGELIAIGRATFAILRR